jgi:cytochrome c oxidase assembly protein subunit 15
MVHLGPGVRAPGHAALDRLRRLGRRGAQTLPSPWGRRGAALIGLVYLQILLGALVAGNDAG